MENAQGATMHEEMIAYVKLHDPVSSRELAAEILKFKNPDETIAHVAIKGILANDKRCYFGDDKLWHASQLSTELPQGRLFSDCHFVAVHLLSLPRILGCTPVHVSVWTVDVSPELVYDAWLENPDLLPHDEQELLRSVRDRPYDQAGLDELAAALENVIPVFMSSRDMSVFCETIARSDNTQTDEALTISTLLRCAQVPVPRPLSIASCCGALLGNAPAFSYAYKYGEFLAMCVQALLDRLAGKGIVGLSGLEASEKDELSAFDFSHKGFGLADIINAPVLPGVYGFKTKENVFLYIGKATNLRRRLMSYFRQTEESPDKIAQIRSESYGLITSVCGSELESLIYEYRLIRKHTPALNTQASINERKGDFHPIEDCVVLLPHAEPDKCMSFWFRKNQKIFLRPLFLDFRDKAALIEEINKFFFGAQLLPHSEDFPEQEIATRWMKRRQDELPVIFINRTANAKEVCEAMESLWKDFWQSPLADPPEGDL
jgi:hypothetical protein